MSNNIDPPENLRLLYEETGAMFRFFLTWRQLLLGGYFAILAALALGFDWALTNHAGMSCAFPFLGFGLSVLFWALDSRNRELYRNAAEVGRSLESRFASPPTVGYYGSYKRGRGFIQHSVILATLYLGGALLLLLFGIFVAATPPQQAPSP